MCIPPVHHSAPVRSSVSLSVCLSDKFFASSCSHMALKICQSSVSCVKETQKYVKNYMKVMKCFYNVAYKKCLIFIYVEYVY